MNTTPRERRSCVRMERGMVPLSDVSVRLMCWTNSGRSGVAGVVPGAVRVCTVIQTRQIRRVRRVQAHSEHACWARQSSGRPWVAGGTAARSDCSTREGKP